MYSGLTNLWSRLVAVQVLLLCKVKVYVKRAPPCQDQQVESDIMYKGRKMLFQHQSVCIHKFKQTKSID